MQLQEAIHARRSIRRFTDQAVPRPLLEGLLKESLWAPSGMNRQPWKFFVLQGGAFKTLVDLSGSMAFDSGVAGKLGLTWSKRRLQSF